MRLAYFFLLFAVAFAADGIDLISAEDAALTTDANPASLPKLIHDAIEIRRLRRRAKVTRAEGEERAGVNAAAAMNLLKRGRPSGKVASALASAAAKPLTRDEKAFIAVLAALGIGAGAAASLYAVLKVTLEK
jgi:hypothetical protein